jgi:hypothetical protein
VALNLKWSESTEEPTSAEAEFMGLLEELSSLNLESALYEDDEGPWMLVVLQMSQDRGGETVIVKTLRLDFDSTGIRGGWSPYNLNADVDVRASNAGVETGPADGIRMAASDGTPAELAQAAVDWFQRHWDEWERARDLPPKRNSWLGRMLGQPE